MSSIPIEKLSLLETLSPFKVQVDNGIKAGNFFADKFDKALYSEGTTSVTTTNAREMAETLTLQMMQSSLDLGDNYNLEHMQTFKSPSSNLLNSFIDAYRENQANSGDSTNLEQASNLLHSNNAVVNNQKETSIAPTTHKLVDGTSWLDPIISKASSKYGVETSLIRAVIKAESDFNPNAVSHAGASGLMQLMPSTARSLGVTDSFDPEQNVMAGTRFLKDMIQRYGGNIDSALAAYNWGPGNVDRHPNQLPRETKDYQLRVKQLYSSYLA